MNFGARSIADISHFQRIISSPVSGPYISSEVFMARRKKSESDQNTNAPAPDSVNQETPGGPPVEPQGVCGSKGCGGGGGCATKKVHVATTYSDGKVNLDAIEVLNGYVVLSTTNQQFLNDGSVVGVNSQFNPLNLQIGDVVLFDFTHQISIDGDRVAVKFDHVIAKVNLSQVISSTIESVMDDGEEDDLAEEIESIAKAPIPVVGDEDLSDGHMETVSSTISIELPTPKSAPPKNTAVVNKTGKPIPQDGVRQLNRPIRR